MVTRLALHFTPVHWQKLLPVHPDGDGISAFASFDMNTPSSAMAVQARDNNRRKSLQRESKGFCFNLEAAIQIWECVWCLTASDCTDRY